MGHHYIMPGTRDLIDDVRILMSTAVVITIVQHTGKAVPKDRMTGKKTAMMNDVAESDRC